MTDHQDWSIEMVGGPFDGEHHWIPGMFAKVKCFVHSEKARNASASYEVRADGRGYMIGKPGPTTFHDSPGPGTIIKDG